ncbi:hypothetical protein [Desulforegula conservatrix]|uniref:hypothetical protein n=1 Tax=Desulforegula conservatrix TaxID=153026 RepID=UPI000401F529|nr:hypothetical protein [Desulforegula conservatrix]
MNGLNKKALSIINVGRSLEQIHKIWARLISELLTSLKKIPWKNKGIIIMSVALLNDF